MYEGRVVVRTWSETEGRILDARVRTQHQLREADSKWPDINYEYFVGAERFTGHCCGETGSFLGSYDHVKAFVDENTPGTRVAIYVNPALVTESRLKASIGRFSGGSPWILLITLTFVAVGVYMLLPPRAQQRLRRLVRRDSAEPIEK